MLGISILNPNFRKVKEADVVIIANIDFTVEIISENSIQPLQ